MDGGQGVILKSFYKRSNSYPKWFFIKVALLYIVLISNITLACYWRGYGDEDYNNPWKHSTPRTSHSLDYDEPDPPTNASKIKNAAIRHVKISWGGWTPPPEVIQEWSDWLIKYESKTNNTDYINKHNRDRLKSERGPGSGWPAVGSWQDLGEGNGGVPAPPWSYAPKNTGKPALCMLSPKKGKCNKNLQRWGYNGYLDKCQNYTWGGCGGSLNRFETKLRCENKCMVPAPSGCVTDSGIARDYQITYDNKK